MQSEMVTKALFPFGSTEFNKYPYLDLYGNKPNISNQGYEKIGDIITMADEYKLINAMYKYFCQKPSETQSVFSDLDKIGISLQNPEKIFKWSLFWDNSGENYTNLPEGRVLFMDYLNEEINIKKIDYGNNHFILNASISFNIAWDEDYFTINYEPLDIFVCEKTREAAIACFNEYFDFLWRTYAEESDNKLIGHALILKQKLKECVSEVQKY